MNTGTVRSFISGSRTAEHFRSLDYRRQMYRNPRHGRIAGVCSGIAEYLEISTFIVRMLTVLSLFVFGPFTFFAYCVCWMVLEKNPHEAPYQSRRQRRRHRRERHAADADVDGDMTMDAASSEADSRESILLSLRECSEAFNIIESRLRGVEAFMTSKKFRLHCEINRI